MSKKEDLVACHFEINANIPKDVYNAFVALQAKLLGIRGWIEETAPHKFTGYIEGNKQQIENLKQLMEKADKLAGEVQKVAFKELKKIDDWTAENFKAK